MCGFVANSYEEFAELPTQTRRAAVHHASTVTTPLTFEHVCRPTTAREAAAGAAAYAYCCSSTAAAANRT
jgi:hypothetical protein